MMDWNILDKQQSAQIMEHIAMASDPDLFSEQTSEASFMTLPFYQDYMLYRVTNYTTLPSFSLEFLSDGESFHLLDGSPTSINLVNSKGILNLSEANVINYTEFYLTHIRGEDGDIYMIRDISDLPFIDSLEIDQKMNLESKHSQPQVEKDPETGNFIVLADLFYGGTLIKSGIIVDNFGKIEIQPRDMMMSTTMELSRR